MARTKSAKKAKRVAERRSVFNARKKKGLKDAVKNISKLIGGKKGAEVQAQLPTFQQAVDKAAKAGIIKKNTAARLKSRISKRIRALA